MYARRVARTAVYAGGGGSVADGEIITRTGPSATKPTVIEWLGGLNGVIDAMSDGTALVPRTNWTELADPPNHPSASNERALNRAKALRFDTRSQPSIYKQTVTFDAGATYKSHYTSAWMYYQHDDLVTGQPAGTYLQWKVFRWTKTETVVDGDGAYLANRQPSPPRDSFLDYFPSTGAATEWFDGSSSPALFAQGAWYRQETWLTVNSSPGTADGSFRIKITDTSGATIRDINRTGLAFNCGGDSDTGFRYICLQNYTGNVQDSGSTLPQNASMVSYWDDTYLSCAASGGAARAELVDHATYASATVRTICEIVSISGNTWNVKINQGRHANLLGKYLALFDGFSETPAMVAV